jgi:hypothetical protein
VIDLEVTGPDAFADALDRSITTGAVVNTGDKRDRLGAVRQRPTLHHHHRSRPWRHRQWRQGRRGTREKDVVLAFAQTLRDRLSRYERRSGLHDARQRRLRLAVRPHGLRP